MSIHMVKNYIVHVSKVYACWGFKEVQSMSVTRSLIKLNNILVKIPKDTGRNKYLSENKWGCRFISKKF